MADFEAIFVDIGEGDATLLRLPGEEWALVDIFRCEDHGIDIFKLLDDRLPEGEGGKKRLDYLILTHAHDDHIRGLADLVERYDVREIWAPRYETSESLGDRFEEFREVVDNHPNAIVPKGSRTPFAHLGQNGEVTVRCFSPPGYIKVGEKLTEDQQRAQVHEYCGVFRFEYQGTSVLLTGDSDLECWQRIVGYYEDKTDENDLSVLSSTVLHASHHGSRTFFTESKGEPLWLRGLEAIKPEVVIVSVGEDNRYEHPHVEAMKSYRDQVGEANVLETRHTGTAVLDVEANGDYQILPDNGEFEDRYRWDDDSGGGGGASGGGSGGSSSPRRSKARLDNSAAA